MFFFESGDLSDPLVWLYPQVLRMMNCDEIYPHVFSYVMVCIDLYLSCKCWQVFGTFTYLFCSSGGWKTPRALLGFQRFSWQEATTSLNNGRRVFNNGPDWRFYRPGKVRIAGREGGRSLKEVSTFQNWPGMATKCNKLWTVHLRSNKEA